MLQIFAKFAAKKFNVFYAYCPRLGEQQKPYLKDTGVFLLPFDFQKKQGLEPYWLYGMKPGIKEIIGQNNIDCVCLPAFARYQFPVNILPPDLPVVLTSPFGHYCSNGNVKKVFVSGRDNLARLKSRFPGVDAELIYDPIEDFSPNYLVRQEIQTAVVFGRIGRADDRIFDPISIAAFAKLEKKYGTRVKYKIVNPPPLMEKMVATLGLQQVEFVRGFEQEFLARLLQSLDIMAHVRKDGETFGKAIAEAMLSGLPIITHKSYFNNEHLNFLDDKFAKWCEPDDVEGYFKNMEWFVLHPQYIRPMGQAARSKALKLFSPDIIMPRIMNVFREACQSHNKNSNKFAGFLYVFWNNLRMLPFALARRLLHIFPRLEAKAISFTQTNK